MTTVHKDLALPVLQVPAYCLKVLHSDNAAQLADVSERMGMSIISCSLYWKVNIVVKKMVELYTGMSLKLERSMCCSAQSCMAIADSDDLVCKCNCK